MKVLLIGSAGKYGAQLSLVYLCNKLKENNIDIEVILPNRGETEDFFRNAGIRYYIIKHGLVWQKPQRDLKQFCLRVAKKIVNYVAEKKIRKIIKNEDIDIIHINSIGIEVGAKSALQLKKRLVWHIREFVDEDLNRQLYNEKKTYALISKADAIIAISHAIYEKYRTLIENPRFRVIYNGIEPSVYATNERKILTNDKKRIIISGRVCPEKGQYLVVEALEYLDELRENIDVEFCGDGNGDNTELERLKNIVCQRGWQNNVFFSGYCDNMTEKYKCADLCIVPSKKEAFGRVTIEAMMAGCLVIGAKSGGTAELLAEQRGLLFEYGKPAMLADAIRWAVLNVEEANAIASSARNYALAAFSAEKNALDIANVYKEIF